MWYYNIIITKWKIWQFNVGNGWFLSECKGVKYGNLMQKNGWLFYECKGSQYNKHAFHAKSRWVLSYGKLIHMGNLQFIIPSK